jgi:hypothetical protein
VHLFAGCKEFFDNVSYCEWVEKLKETATQFRTWLRPLSDIARENYQ